MLHQQGDVLFKKINRFPGDIKKYESNILAEGEATGHAHAIDLANADVYRDEQNNLYIDVTGENAVVKHEEHNQINIPKGRYKIAKVREYDHFKREVRKVVD